MKPATFSATALNVAALCLARYKAEQIDRGRGKQNAAASLGSAVHGALELYVKAVYIDKTQERSEKLLLELFQMSYMTTLGTSDTNTEDYKDGVAMLKAWFKRDSLGQSNRTVLTCEVKTNFEVKTSIGPLPFNYIYDRFDQTADTEYTVVDYKTNRWGINPDDLRKKVQARAYALAGQIAHPDATRIWVEFEMLRHEGPVGVVFTRDDNIETWAWIKREAERIIATPDDDVPETLNAECNFCVRKQSCAALKRNVAVGGIHRFSSAEEMTDHRAQLEYQLKAVASAIKEIDEVILAEAKEKDKLEFEGNHYDLAIGISSRRDVDAERVEHVIGSELFHKYGSASMTMAAVDKLLKGSELTPEQKTELKGLIYMKKGNPSVKVKERGVI